MNNILITEFSPAKGHADLFCALSRILSSNKDNNVEIIAPMGSNLQTDLCGYHEMPFAYFSEKKIKNRWMSFFLSLLYEIRIIMYIAGLSKKIKYDVLIVVTYNELSLALGYRLLKRFEKKVIVHNNNIDKIDKDKYRRIAFDFFSNDVYHIVLADFIKEHLILAYNLEQSRIITLPDPYTYNCYDKTQNVKDIDCLGISNGNDESFIEYLIKEEKKNGIFEKNGLHVVLKSSQYKYDNGYLTIINGFLPRSVFEDYLSRAKVMLIPFHASYKYRMSGTLVDALSHCIPVIASPIELIEHAKRVYPHSIKLLNRSSFIEDIVNLAHNDEKKDEEFKNFIKIHSVEYLSSSFAMDLTDIIEDKFTSFHTYDF